MEDCVELTDKEWGVCRSISEAEEGVRFGDLKRSSQLHQEVLSRIVRRLRVHGLVENVDGKYRSSSMCCNREGTSRPEVVNNSLYIDSSGR